ncbi:SDR family oxidoreductase [Brenneria izadpanahii]|uniref:SDR family oxidoreductase n=1 Tax=Brenneria izadpanahii TaxID=2722756 RepID=A0ABX7URZ9_9GAMM|nr:SDR family NAD(P)-dependent oxidoreductase [Brenneria izadpanahii]QTF08518.1 SDR family oxidoreductase [Brenneria izadpanahii]
MQIRFDGRKAIVTGAAQGIGREIAASLAQAGADLWLCDIDSAGLAQSLAFCRAQAPEADIQTAVVDVSQRQEIQSFVKSVGEVDVLINVAGGVCGQTGHPIDAISEEAWRRIFAVNSDAMFWFSQAVVPAMKRKGWGRIVTISSIAGLGISLTGIQAYAASKAAEVALTRQLAHELGPYGITVNAVAPGFVRSNPTTELQWEAYGAEGQKALLESIALRRTGVAGDIAPAVLFLASEHSGWTTGQTLAVDGGK